MGIINFNIIIKNKTKMFKFLALVSYTFAQSMIAEEEI